MSTVPNTDVLFRKIRQSISSWEDYKKNHKLLLSLNSSVMPVPSNDVALTNALKNVLSLQTLKDPATPSNDVALTNALKNVLSLQTLKDPATPSNDVVLNTPSIDDVPATALKSPELTEPSIDDVPATALKNDSFSKVKQHNNNGMNLKRLWSEESDSPDLSDLSDDEP